MPQCFKSWLMAAAATLTLARADCFAPPDTSYSNFRDTFCSNQTLLIGNQYFDASNPSGTVHLPGAAADGGDSVIFVNLVFFKTPETFLNQNICEGDTLWVNGTAYHANFYLGEEIVEGGGANGCDSIIHVNLQVLTPPFSYFTDTLCPDDFLMFNGNRYDRDNRTGLEILPGAASNGCDSLVYLSLSFRELWLYIGEDREIVVGDTVCITPQFGLVPQSLVWSPAPPCPDSLCTSYCIQPSGKISFLLAATDTSGCVVTDDITITVSDENRVFAPNVFNPDAAEPNNRFFISTDDGVTLIRRLLIADRWGGIVFEKENLTPGEPSQGWDGSRQGKIAPVGVYTFWAELEKLDGTRFEKSGTVSLAR